MGKVQDHKRAAKGRRQLDTTKEKATRTDRLEIAGEVEECLPNTMFRVKVTECEVEQMIGKVLLGTLAGKMRLYRIRVMPGDVVKGYVSKYDLTKCKVTYRINNKPVHHT
ncbi:MAG: translation initiation factor IF-1 [Candidatus Pacebacteria bacterium]|mgnify:CR=1 FL=1|jgi:translation initiation factor IF-1|nr:translation initiation factor IF-1 [Candidatus Paceibacterota bacterium]MBT4652370.1 translation initiation factor IF-1 [Candidatus Paceibacterota bacterium]MBT6756197.1 translation initiation factor IF-1 [Candidatus Paceibacterota bacterium]MBT6921488.1 translation initiation factor IF-1 [Candidatus Paceibacterota bacterium]